MNKISSNEFFFCCQIQPLPRFFAQNITFTSSVILNTLRSISVEKKVFSALFHSEYTILPNPPLRHKSKVVLKTTIKNMRKSLYIAFQKLLSLCKMPSIQLCWVIYWLTFMFYVIVFKTKYSKEVCDDG